MGESPPPSTPGHQRALAFYHATRTAGHGAFDRPARRCRRRALLRHPHGGTHRSLLPEHRRRYSSRWRGAPIPL